MTRVDAKSAKMFVKNIGVVSMGKLAHTHPKAGVEYELNTTRRSRVVFRFIELFLAPSFLIGSTPKRAVSNLHHDPFDIRLRGNLSPFIPRGLCQDTISLEKLDTNN